MWIIDEGEYSFLNTRAKLSNEELYKEYIKKIWEKDLDYRVCPFHPQLTTDQVCALELTVSEKESEENMIDYYDER